MNRKWTRATLLLVGMVVVLGVGCKKKAPATPEAPMDPVPPVTSAPEDVEDTPMEPSRETPDPMDLELVEFNRYVQENGLIGDVYYDFDKYALKPDARDRLAKNAAYLKENPSIQVTVEGHCDERGTNEYNLALGDRRSNAATDYMASLGIGSGRMRNVSFGEEKPVCNERSTSCWSRNRRGHFVVTAK